MRSYIIIILLLLCKYFPSLGNNRDNENIILSCEIEYGHIIVKAKINNIPGRYMLDTGAGLCMISTDFYSSVNTKVCDSITLDANNISKKTPLILLDKISLDDRLNFDSVSATFNENSDALLKLLNIDGILGSNLFQNSILQIDMHKKEVRILNNITESYRSNYFVSDIDFAPGVPYIFIGIGDTIKDLPVMFDTGSDKFYIMSEDIYKQSIPYNVFDELMTSVGHNIIGALGLQKADTCHLLRIPTLKINSVIFKNTRVVTKHGKTTIGTRLLDYGIATVDYINKRFYFEPYENKKRRKNKGKIINMEKEQGSPSINVTSADKKLIIGFIWDKILKKRISVGDQVISIWGKNIEDLDDRETLEFYANSFTLFHRVFMTVRKNDGKKISLFVKIME